VENTNLNKEPKIDKNVGFLTIFDCRRNLY